MTIKNPETEAWNAKMDELRQVLADRLPLNRSWQNVSITTRKTYLEIKWFDSKVYEDEFGHFSFKLDRISPRNQKSLDQLVDNQKLKLAQDRRNDTRDEPDVG